MLKEINILSADRVVDDLNPVLTFTRKEVESLLHYVEEEPDPSQSVQLSNDGMEAVIKHACLRYPHLITKVGDLTVHPPETCSFHSDR